MSATDILQQLKLRQLKPVYFLHGEESYYIDLIGNYIEHQVLSDAEKGFNQSVFYGKDTDFTTVLNSAKRFPMMSDYQLVMVKEAQELDIFAGRASKEKEAKMEQFLAYLAKPLSSTILVFCHKYDSVDKRLKFVRMIEKNGVLFESSKLYESKVPQWAVEFVQSRGYKLSPKASALIAEYLGADLSKIANELEKLMLNIPKGMEIGINEVEANIGISKEFNVFELHNALGRKDVYKCNQIVSYFAANPKANPMVLVLGNLNNFFTKIFTYHFLKDRSKASVADALKINQYFVRDYETAAKNFSLTKTIEIISLLREYDLKSKGVEAVNADQGELMKEMVYRMLH